MAPPMATPVDVSAGFDHEFVIAAAAAAETTLHTYSSKLEASETYNFGPTCVGLSRWRFGRQISGRATRAPTN